MILFTTYREESLEEIARVMSNEANCDVQVEDVRLESSTKNLSVYGAMIFNFEEDSLRATNIICTVKYPEKLYEVKVEKLDSTTD